MSQTFTQANALLSVTGLPCGSIGTTTGVPQIAADFLERANRQRRASCGLRHKPLTDDSEPRAQIPQADLSASKPKAWTCYRMFESTPHPQVGWRSCGIGTHVRLRFGCLVCSRTRATVYPTPERIGRERVSSELE